jgi:hypothetical protein
MKLWGYESTQKCPGCGHHCETAAHVTMCTAPSAIEQWKILLETLGKNLAKQHTHPGLTRFLMSRLLEWKTRTPRKAIRTMEHDLQELQDAQDEMDGTSSCLEIYPYCGKKSKLSTFEK